MSKKKSLFIHFSPIRDAILSPDGQHIITLETEGMMCVIKRDTFEEDREIEPSSISSFKILSLSPNKPKKSLVVADDVLNILNVAWPDVSNKNPLQSTPEEDQDYILGQEIKHSVVATDPTGEILAFSAENDPVVKIIKVDDPTSKPRELFDNVQIVEYAGFDPNYKTLVTINRDGEILTFPPKDNYSECIPVETKVKTIPSAVCFTSDSQFLVSDAENNGTFHIFYFEDDNNEKHRAINIDGLEIIKTMAVSETFLLATGDQNKIVISRIPDRMSGNKTLSRLMVLDPGSDVTTLMWAGNQLYAGDSLGSFHTWDEFQTDSVKEIPVVSTTLENENELSDSDSDADNLNQVPKETRRIISRNKHEAEPSKLHQKSKPKKSKLPDDYSSTADYNEEEEEIEYRKNQNPYIMDEASESSGGDYEYEEEGRRRSRSNQSIPEFKKKLTSEDLAQRIKDKFNIQEYSTTPSETETESDHDRPLTKEEIKELREMDRREKQLDNDFIVGSGSEVSEHEEEEEAIEAVLDSGSEISDFEEHHDLHQFMPSSTDYFENKRMFLCCNLIAKIYLRENADETTCIDVDYNDLSKYRSIHFENKEKLILGTVSSTGVALASRSRVHYKTHDFKNTLTSEAWANDKECIIRMDYDETIDLIAAGNGWFAISTSIRRLRIFMASGLEIGLLNIPQRPMTMIGGDYLLAVIYCNIQNIEQDLFYSLYDVKKRSLISEGPMPIKKEIKWIGFEDRTLYVYGNDHVLYALIFDFGYQFVPIANVQSKHGDFTEFWGVGVSDGQFWGYFLPNDRKFPEPSNNLKLKGIDIEPQCVDENSIDYLLKRYVYCNSSKDDKEKMAIKMDIELLKQFGAAEKNKLYEKMYQIGLQINSKKGQKAVLDFARKKDDKSQEIADKLEEYYSSFNQNDDSEEETKNEQQNEQNENEQNENEQKSESDEPEKSQSDDDANRSRILEEAQQNESDGREDNKDENEAGEELENDENENKSAESNQENNENDEDEDDSENNDEDEDDNEDDEDSIAED